MHAVVIIFLIVVIAGLFVIGFYFDKNLNSDKRQRKRVFKFGFNEKQVQLPNQITLNYGEGPKNGAPLLLIHGQGVDWQNYAKVLPELSQKFHIYAVDCHGHGKSSKNPTGYVGEKMGMDFIWFIENIIKKNTYVSGHSSGGLIAVWMAAHSKSIKGVVLEDPPLFSTEKGRCEKTYAWVDSFQIIHQFYNQSVETDYLIYYLQNSYWKDKFGKLWNSIIKQAKKIRAKHPNGVFRLFYLPVSVNRIWEVASNDNYDKKFGEAFYTGSWMENFDHAKTLREVQCPSILIYAKHTKWKQYDENGILLGAMDDQDANLASQLLPKNELIRIDSGHGVHDEKPKEFIEIVKSANNGDWESRPRKRL